MERYFKGQKRSIYDFIRNRNFGKYDSLIPEKLLELQNHSEEQMELVKLIKKLQKKIIDEQDISELIKQLEYFLPLGNNNKLMNFLLFNSRNFIDIIECINYAKPKHMLNLLHFIEKMIKTNSSIAKYVSNNKSFLRLILKLMQDKNYFEICIKISEEIFINCNELIPLGELFQELQEIYLKSIEQEKLDSFCRILAIMVFDNKKIEFKQIFKYKDYLKLHPKPKTTTQNQNICFHLPNLLTELTATLKRKNERIMLFVDHMSKINLEGNVSINSLLANTNFLSVLNNSNTITARNQSVNNLDNIQNDLNNDIFMENDLISSDEIDSDEIDLYGSGSEDVSEFIDNVPINNINNLNESQRNRTNNLDINSNSINANANIDLNTNNNINYNNVNIVRNNIDSSNESSNNYKPNLFKNNNFSDVNNNFARKKNEIFKLNKYEQAAKKIKIENKIRKEKKIFIVEWDPRKNKNYLLYEEAVLDPNIFESITYEINLNGNLNEKQYIIEKNDTKLDKISYDKLEDLLKISVWELIQYLDQHESEKMNFFGNNIIGEIIKAKLNTGDPFIYVSKKQFKDLLQKSIFYSLKKQKYEEISDKNARQIFNCFFEDEFKKIIYSKPFEFFIPNWDDLKTKHKNPDNIYNTYIKFSKNLKTIKNKNKIAENMKQYVQILKYKSYQIEMLFVLSTLLGCKRKNEIQNNLSKLNLIQEMNRYFEYNEWGNIFEENPRPAFNQDINYSDDTAFHGEGCKCDQEVGFKVQFLRFVYSFCCRDNDNIENKLSMFSKSDLEDTFANSFFYFFYVYLNLQKIKINNLTPGKNAFSALCDKIFILEKKIGNSFSSFFDFMQFENLFYKANNFFKDKIHNEQEILNLSLLEKRTDKDNKDKEISMETDKDLILGGNDIDIEIAMEIKEYGNDGMSDTFQINIANTKDANNDIKIKNFNNNTRKNLTFRTTKISKNHYNKGILGMQKLQKTSNDPLNSASQKLFKLIQKNNRYLINNLIQNLIINDINIENILKNVIEKYNKNDQSCGLLLKMVLKYLSECYFSTPKFWLASCIEVMIRGNNQFFQYYIVKLGLMPCLLYDIIYNKHDSLQIMQLSFDILGELIKFNRANFFLMNYYFVDNNEFSIFTKKIIAKETLVDSNVFLRSIILSTYNFDKADFELGLDYERNEFFTQNCKFCKFINENMFLVFNTLVNIVRPDGINQTNISCINTALLILILNYLRGEKYIGEFLQIIREKFEDSKEGLENFRNLLFIWKEFYSYRPKDSSSLLHSTTIDFSTWQKVTSILLNEDPEKEDSLFYKEKKNDDNNIIIG